MVWSSSPTVPLVSPTQVWPGLAVECQGRAVRLLVHLACNLVAAQGAGPFPEVPHAVPPRDFQAPAHSPRPPGLIYVRQSTLAQVREHTASTARQYDLVQRARDLGWPPEQIVVIDQDQGRSGASATERDGFQQVVATVGLGQAGAVLSLEASRLARASSDWYRLLELCALTETLVIDEDDLYDPGQYNDRLLLGFKGTMSEAEQPGAQPV